MDDQVRLFIHKMNENVQSKKVFTLSDRVAYVNLLPLIFGLLLTLHLQRVCSRHYDNALVHRTMGIRGQRSR
jgi:hypothetical protein